MREIFIIFDVILYDSVFHADGALSTNTNKSHMRKILTMLLVALVAVAVGAEARKKQAVAKFDQTAYSFGTIPEKGGKVSHTFEFTNEGDANLIIVDASADCGCTVPEYPTAPIAPGKKGKIKVTFNPLYRPGAFDKVVTVRTNGKQKKVRLKISGTVNSN